jgi:hypothetical protein
MSVKVVKVEEEISISDLILIDSELSGYSHKKGDEIVVVKGLLSQNLLGSVKVHLVRLVCSIGEIRDSFNKVRKELIDKHGEIKDAKDGSKYYWFGKNMDAFKKEESDLLDQKFKITIPKFDGDDLFGFKCEEVYPFSIKFLLKSEDGV